MTLATLRNPPARIARIGVLIGVGILVFVAYALPFFGLLASMCLPLVTHKARGYLWTETSGSHSLAWSVTAWVGLWLPALVSFFAPVVAGPEVGGFEPSTVWLLIPLCAPDSLDALLLPALAAAGTGLAGLLGAVAMRRPWPWLAAAWLAPWVHHLAFTRIPHDFLC